MPYTLSVEREDEYIRFDLYDPLTQSEIDSAMEEVLKLRQEGKLNRILCDHRQLEMPPSETVGFLTAEQFGKRPLLGTKMALIRRRADEEFLFDIAAQTRGVIIRIFEDEEAAKQWLLDSP
jgi:hypothetical protein